MIMMIILIIVITRSMIITVKSSDLGPGHPRDLSLSQSIARNKRTTVFPGFLSSMTYAEESSARSKNTAKNKYTATRFKIAVHTNETIAAPKVQQDDDAF